MIFLSLGLYSSTMKPELFSILVIDDDEDDRSLFCQAVKDLGSMYECRSANACRSGIAEIVNNPQQAQLIFLDQQLSDIDGLECLRILKSHSNTSQIPVVMISGVNNERVCREAERLGVLHYYVKPHSFRELSDFVGSVVKELNQQATNKESG